MLRSVFPVLIVALAGDLLRVLSTEGVCLIGLLSVGFLDILGQCDPCCTYHVLMEVTSVWLVVIAGIPEAEDVHIAGLVYSV